MGKNIMTRNYSNVFLLLLLIIFSTGCATNKLMPLQKGGVINTTTGAPIFLMSANVKNIYRAGFQPKIGHVVVEKIAADQSMSKVHYKLDRAAKDESNDPKIGSNYLLRFDLEAGNYIIRGMYSSARRFPIQASFFIPVHGKVSSLASGVYYLGHINATVRERVGDEFKAGSSIPLINQAIAGASGGTFDIEIVDRWEKDESLFLSKFSVLEGVDIKKMILPPFNREVAQKWWEDH